MRTGPARPGRQARRLTGIRAVLGHLARSASTCAPGRPRHPARASCRRVPGRTHRKAQNTRLGTAQLHSVTTEITTQIGYSRGCWGEVPSGRSMLSRRSAACRLSRGDHGVHLEADEVIPVFAPDIQQNRVAGLHQLEAPVHAAIVHHPAADIHQPFGKHAAACGGPLVTGSGPDRYRSTTMKSMSTFSPRKSA